MKIGLGVIGGIIALAGCGTGAATNAGAAPEQGSAAPAPAPAPAPSSPAAAITAWSDGGGGKRLSVLNADFSAISTAAQAADVAGLNTACHSLQSDTESAQAYAPIPDDQAQQSWASGLAQSARAASDCISGTDRNDASLITQSGQEAAAAGEAFVIAGQRIIVLAGQ